MALGTLSMLDDLENDQRTVSEFGEEALADRFAEALRVHNEMTEQIIDQFAFVTDEYVLPYGGSASIEMVPLDEFGQADAQKITGGGNVYFPLRAYGTALQWTRLYLRTHGTGKLAKQLDAAAAADIRNLQKVLRQTLFRPTNVTIKDVRQTNLNLEVKALLNADGMEIPLGLDALTFDANTHTHYLGSATLTLAAYQGLVNTVVEHGITGGMVVMINKAQEQAVRALAGFVPYVDSRIQFGGGSTVDTAGSLDMVNLTNRAIGILEGAEIWVKPWIPANYMAALALSEGDDKPIAIRTRSGTLQGEDGGFMLVAEEESHPLRANQWYREFGAGVYQRHRAAVLYIGNASYVAPTI